MRRFYSESVAAEPPLTIGHLNGYATVCEMQPFEATALDRAASRLCTVVSFHVVCHSPNVRITGTPGDHPTGPIEPQEGQIEYCHGGYSQRYGPEL